MSEQPGRRPDPRSEERGEQREPEPVVVVTGSAMSVAGGEGSDAATAVGSVEQPAKVMRIGSMVKQLLEEVRGAPLDEAGRARLAQVHERSLAELEEGLSPELVAELRRITLPFSEGTTPTDAELRIAQAQLVGWLEGLFHGIQTALFAQQMAARAQLEQMRRALPAGAGGAPGVPGAAGRLPVSPDAPAPGQYL
ncbi:Protein of unknown function [Quadrisphaera sp. DSM 44207]|nr:bacterial proteasome activator family protein [Quadrisphaera sp. DSM 44207]SDQ20907.1 Protein of unknown function [Quadrisphaera sp. DSM 44207]